MRSLLFLLVLLIPCTAAAIGLEEKLHDPAQEARAQVIFKQLRCMVCTGESIHDSNADLAQDLRKLVRERIDSGESNEAIISYIVSRYGESILMEPPVKTSTYALWFSPLIFLLIGGVALISIGFKKAKK